MISNGDDRNDAKKRKRERGRPGAGRCDDEHGGTGRLGGNVHLDDGAELTKSSLLNNVKTRGGAGTLQNVAHEAVITGSVGTCISKARVRSGTQKK
ncbi:hypothetical protein PIB30_022831 [Stylosanthes scabra]|uniref:Uncharacterized protein n=1 Tax=Stylosanthes scabra TaxID=79078 RepID=A0ABU6VBK8_9FABA|nr:hypothetical protein [Stylosanthes scabra]